MEFKDYYKILGVSENADTTEIKKAYRKLARKYHPDVSAEADAETRFKEVGEAYDVLGDPGRRAEYDQIRKMGAAGVSGHGAGQAGFDEADPGRQFRDFFESIFGGMNGMGGGAGGGGAWQQAFDQRGQDVTHRIALFLEEAVEGVERDIRLKMPEIDAAGRVHQRNRTLRVRIPPGVVPGQRIRLAGQGGPGSGRGPAGDLYLEVELASHPRFEVDGKDLLLKLPVTPWEAALGAKVDVPTLHGPVRLSIPKGASSGKKLRLKGRGLGRNPPGDLVVTLEVAVPSEHCEAAEDLYRQLARVEADFNPRRALETRQ